MNSWRLFGEQVRAWGRTSLLLSVRRQHGATAWVDTGQVRPIAQKDAAFHRVHGRALVALVSSVVFIALLVWFGARLYCGAALRTGGRVSLREAYRAG